MSVATTKVVVGSAFRSTSPAQAIRWVDQIHALSAVIETRAVAVCGDDDGRSAKVLSTYGDHISALTVHEFNHGGPHFGSVESDQRMAQLSKVGNAILDHADTQPDEYLLYVESDLIWTPEAVLSLVAQLDSLPPWTASISPATFAGEAFYDVWAFRHSGGVRFGPFEPYCPMYAAGRKQFRVDSAGSCLLMRPAAANRFRMNTGALVEWCDRARYAGYDIYVDMDTRIHHP